MDRWQAGDREALDRLLAEELPWLERVAERRIGPRLRAREEAADLVQMTAYELLRYARRAVVPDRRRFRGLLVRILENVIRGEADRLGALKRDVAREHSLPADNDLQQARGATSGSEHRPSRAAQRAEDKALVDRGLEALAPPEREILLLREREGLSFEQIGQRCGISSEAARKRHTRALVRLGLEIVSLRSPPASRVSDP